MHQANKLCYGLFVNGVCFHVKTWSSLVLKTVLNCPVTFEPIQSFQPLRSGRILIW